MREPTNPNAEVMFRVTSWNNVTLDDVVGTTFTRSEWLDLSYDERAEAINVALNGHFSVTLLDEPQQHERASWASNDTADDGE